MIVVACATSGLVLVVVGLGFMSRASYRGLTLAGIGVWLCFMALVAAVKGMF